VRFAVLGGRAVVIDADGVVDVNEAIFTRTPARLGFTRTPPRFLTGGDVLVSSIQGIGELRTDAVESGGVSS
jgi:hypothetical protein